MPHVNRKVWSVCGKPNAIDFKSVRQCNEPGPEGITGTINIVPTTTKATGSKNDKPTIIRWVNSFLIFFHEKYPILVIFLVHQSIEKSPWLIVYLQRFRTGQAQESSGVIDEVLIPTRTAFGFRKCIISLHGCCSLATFLHSKDTAFELGRTTNTLQNNDEQSNLPLYHFPVRPAGPYTNNSNFGVPHGFASNRVLSY
jgi:hypothetical protein